MKTVIHPEVDNLLIDKFLLDFFNEHNECRKAFEEHLPINWYIIPTVAENTSMLLREGYITISPYGYDRKFKVPDGCDVFWKFLFSIIDLLAKMNLEKSKTTIFSNEELKQNLKNNSYAIFFNFVYYKIIEIIENKKC